MNYRDSPNDYVRGADDFDVAGDCLTTLRDFHVFVKTMSGVLQCHLVHIEWNLSRSTRNGRNQKGEATMSKFLAHPVHASWHAHSSHVKAMLGISPGAKLPPQGRDPQVIQGIKVWVLPLEDNAPRSGTASYRKAARRMSHRVRAECPDCGKEMSAGRLHQHVCK